MRIGLMSGATPGPDGTLDGIVARAQNLEAAGFHALWMANIFGLDAITREIFELQIRCDHCHTGTA